jgi:hypothetical protein
MEMLSSAPGELSIDTFFASPLNFRVRLFGPSFGEATKAPAGGELCR